MAIIKFENMIPDIKNAAFVAEDASLIGKVELGVDASIWYGSVVRADTAAICIGKYTNIQDRSVIHGENGENVEIGDHVTMGHGVIFHGSKIGDRCLIGMGSTILCGVEIGEDSIIGAGALVEENMIIPPGSLVVGVPAKVVREVKPEQKDSFINHALSYVELAKKQKKKLF